MKYLPLIWAGLWRKPTRTVLTSLSIIVAFVLFGAMYGVALGFNGALNKMSDVRLRVVSRANMLEPLPLAHKDRIARVPGVEGISQIVVMLGWYQKPDNTFAVPGVDFRSARPLFPEMHMPDDQYQKLLATPDGAVMGARLAEKMGWKIGDRIPVHTAVMKKDGSDVWTFQIVGIVNGNPKDDKTLAGELWGNFDYLDKARVQGEGFANQYIVKISDPARAASIGAAIDAMFANSPYETRTVNEKDYLADQIRQIGDIGLFIRAILGAVLFTLLFLIGNTMMQSVRERIPELAVLKAVGFQGSSIVATVAFESVFLCCVAAAIGLGISAVLLPALIASIGIPMTTLPGATIATGLAIAASLGLVISVFPAWRAWRLRIVDGLAGH